MIKIRAETNIQIVRVFTWLAWYSNTFGYTMKNFSALIQAKFFKFKRIFGIYRDFWYLYL